MCALINATVTALTTNITAKNFTVGELCARVKNFGNRSHTHINNA